MMIAYDCCDIDKDKKTKSLRNYAWEEANRRVVHRTKYVQRLS